MKSEKLSTRIVKLMKHCPTCHGTGHYIKVFPPAVPPTTMDVSCSSCADIKVILKGARQLEKQVLALTEEIIRINK
jgi:hypothetical protein